MNWTQLSKEDRIDLLSQVSTRSGLPPEAIEKDWWVTIALKAVYSLPIARYFVFKGGTSLSKGWNLIERFSEDIDLAVDREFFGIKGELTKLQIKKLRKASSLFVYNELCPMLVSQFNMFGLSGECAVEAEKEGSLVYPEPRKIFIRYQSVLQGSSYLGNQVMLEIGARSLLEPVENRPIQSLISSYMPVGETIDDASLDAPFDVPAALPQKTFLEKAFLLHELFSLSPERMKADRKSRHLYDLEKLMDTEYGKSALENPVLFKTIARHRQIFTSVSGVDYKQDICRQICLVPPETVIDDWKDDYRNMQGYMIYGKSLTFDDLIRRLSELQERFRNSSN